MRRQAHGADSPSAVVLSGSARDGSLGGKAIKNMGGRVIMQDEASECEGMPPNEIAPALLALVGRPAA